VAHGQRSVAWLAVVRHTANAGRRTVPAPPSAPRTRSSPPAACPPATCLP